jgi:HAD superfamily hydrolase (TIGR01509 family)
MPFTVLWDNDGVLVLTEERYFQACRETLARLDVMLTREYFIEQSLVRGQSVFELIAERGFTREQMRELRRERDRRYTELIEATPCVIDGVEDVLRTLHGRVRMGVVTGSLRTHFDHAHARTGLLPYFDFILAREDYQHSKPHPDSYRTALERFDIASEQAVVVEDTARGLAAARAAGLRCIIVPNDLTREQDFTGATDVLDSIRDVPAVVERLMQ